MLLNQNLLEELIGDNFAGGGGASTGIAWALGRHPDHAINHDSHALGMHRINHPETVHHCEDVFNFDPIRVAGRRRWGLVWFSPDCKHFSKAKGGKPLSKKIRGLAFVMLRWAKAGVRVMPMENVEEIVTWGPLLHHPRHGKNCSCGKPCGRPDPKHKGRTWRALLDALGPGIAPDHPDLPEMLEVVGDYVTRAELIRGFGYTSEVRELRGCDYGAPTIRKRLFKISRCDGRPIVWPEPTHFNPNDPRGAQAIAEGRGKPWRTIAECIDWSLPCPSIFLTRKQARKFGCRRPLAKSTRRRIAMGIDRYVLKAERPFLVSLTHQGGDRIEPIDEPSRTLTAAHRGEKAVVIPGVAPASRGSGEGVAPFLTEHANASSQRNVAVDKPGPTTCAEVKGGHFALVAPVIARTAHGEQDRNGKRRGKGAHQADEPLPTGTASKEFALVSANIMVNTSKHTGSPATEPAPTVVANHHHVVTTNLVKLRGDAATHNKPQHPDEPLDTISAGGCHHAVVAGTLVQTGYGERKGQKPRALDPKKPLGTIVSGGKHAVVTGTIVGAGGPARSGEPKPIDKPMHSLVTKNNSHLAAVHLTKFNTGATGQPVDQPGLTIVAGRGAAAPQGVVAASVIKYYGNDKDGQQMEEPAHTVTTKERFALAECPAEATPLTPEQLIGARRVAKFLRDHGVKFEGEFATVCGYVIVDIGMRMLTPRELFRAQGFPEDYVIDRAWIVNEKTGEIEEVELTKEQQIRMCGNSVCPPLVRALIAANCPELMVWKRGEPHRLPPNLMPETYCAVSN